MSRARVSSCTQEYCMHVFFRGSHGCYIYCAQRTIIPSETPPAVSARSVRVHSRRVSRGRPRPQRALMRRRARAAYAPAHRAATAWSGERGVRSAHPHPPPRPPAVYGRAPSRQAATLTHSAVVFTRMPSSAQHAGPDAAPARDAGAWPLPGVPSPPSQSRRPIRARTPYLRLLRSSAIHTRIATQSSSAS